MTYDEDGNFDAAYTYGLERIEIEALDDTRPESQDPLYYLYDGLGSVTFMVKSDGNKRDHYRYDEYGNPAPGNSKLSEDGRNVNHNAFGYTGELWDEEDDLLYLRSRYYAPKLGRFMTRDVFHGYMANPLSMHKYAYVENSPVNYVDPLGFNKKEADQGISEYELKNKLEELVSKHLNFVEYNKNIGFYSTSESIDIVLKHDRIISEASNRLSVQKELIQTVLFKEIRMYDTRDVAADSFVMNYFSWKEEMELYMESPWYIKLLVEAPKQPFPASQDSSTGLGQIFAKTAINAHNAAIDRGDIEGQKLNWDDWRERKEIWYKLRDDDENIFYAGLVLKRKAEILVLI